jgi:hypothetical protein
MPEDQGVTPSSIPDHLLEYRKHLVAAEQKAQEDFDKTVLALSGGALGVSFGFLRDVIGANPIQSPSFLLAAWICWGSSTLAVLASYYMSQMALRHAICETDRGRIYGQQPGGRYAAATAWLNAVGAALFLAGVLCITLFAAYNFPTKGVTNEQIKGSVSTPQSAAVAASSSSSTVASTGTGRSQRPDNRGIHTSSSASSPTK